MRAVVFSGTTEGRVFSKQLAALGAEVTPRRDQLRGQLR